jgi:hypothetical protein
MGNEELSRLGVTIRHLEGDARVLHKSGVALVGQVGLADDGKASLDGRLHPIPEPGREDGRFVSKAVELLGDRQQVGLASAQSEVVGGK